MGKALDIGELPPSDTHAVIHEAYSEKAMQNRLPRTLCDIIVYSEQATLKVDFVTCRECISRRARLAT